MLPPVGVAHVDVEDAAPARQAAMPSAAISSGVMGMAGHCSG